MARSGSTGRTRGSAIALGCGYVLRSSVGYDGTMDGSEFGSSIVDSAVAAAVVVAGLTRAC